MSFETVQKIDKNKLVRDKKGDFFLKKRGLEELTKPLQEYSLLYFLRKSDYQTFHDFPALGVSKTVLTRSFVKGPFTVPTKIEKKIHKDYSKEVIERIMPSNKIPESFEKIKLIRYGIRSGDEFGPTLRGRIDGGKVREIGERALRRLKKFSRNLEVIKTAGDPMYRVMVEDCIAEFAYSKEGFFYPTVYLTVFGMGDKPEEIIRELDLYELEDVFEPYDRDLGLKYCTQEGLAYNLFSQEINLDKLEEYDNMIL